MPEELLTPENVSEETLKAVFDAAFMETTYDQESGLRVKDDVMCFVMLNDKKDRVTLLTMFGFHPGVSRLQRLECVNQINNEYIMVRAIVGKNDILRFEYDLPLAGGISKKAFILAVKRFCAIPRNAVADCGKDLVE